MLGLNLTLSSGRGLPFNPSRLFRAGEQGFWFDPSDLSTLFQDAKGTVPVTSVEQPVGLMLDKSKGLVRGPELVTNGDFGTGDLTGWSHGGGDGVVEVTELGARLVRHDGTADEILIQTVFGTPGKTYELTFDVTEVSGSNLWVRINGENSLAGINSVGPRRVVFTSDGQDELRFLQRVVNGMSSVDNISVRELLGNHAYQKTATSRPVLRQDGSGKYYLYFDGVDDWLVTPTITPGIDKVQVFAGVRKLSGSSGTIAELSGNFNNNAGTFWLSSSTEFQFTNHLQGYSGFKTSALATTFTGVLAIVSDLSLPGEGGGEVPTLRLNGASDRAEAVYVAADNTGTFGNYPLYIGRRGGTTLSFNGHIYSMIVRFGSNLPIEAIEQVEAWINGKTGAY